MAGSNNTTKILIWVAITIATAGILIWLISIFFPQMIAKLSSLLVGLLVVVTGMFLRRKK